MFCYHAGYRIRYVSVSTAEHPDRSDICQHDFPARASHSDILAHLLISLAGLYAEHRATHGEPMAHQSYEGFLACVVEETKSLEAGAEEIPSDYMNAGEMIRLASKGTEDLAEKLYAESCRQVSSQVEKFGGEIEAVAHRLSEVGYLEGEEVASTIQGVRRATRQILLGQSGP